MSNYNTTIAQHNTDLQDILTTVNELPDAGGGGDFPYTLDDTLFLENGVLGVNTAQEPDPDNTLPITAAAVAQTVGNIELILQTI